MPVYTLILVMACPAAFEELATNFKLSEAVRDYLWKEPPSGLGLESVADLEYFANTGEDVDKIVAKIGVDDAVRQGARLKRAWMALKQAAAEELEVKKRGSVAVDLDELLPQPELDSMRNMFWARHKIPYPPHMEPSDAVVSRLQRELSKRMLTVRDISWVKSMAHQLKTDSKRLRVGGEANIYVETGGNAVAVAPPRDASTYIDALTVLMIGYAKAGITPIVGAPVDEPLGSGTVNFVECPLDVAMRYVWRADAQSRFVPYASRFEWLKTRDQAERLRWVEVHRNSNLTLGAVIEMVFLQREGIWQPPETVMTAPAPKAPSNPKREAERQQPQVEGSRATHAGDGSKFCVPFQTSHCERGKRCPDLHACAVILKNGRICMDKGHGANGHKKSGKGKGKR